MARIEMRRIQPGEVPKDGGTALQEAPDRPVRALLIAQGAGQRGASTAPGVAGDGQGEDGQRAAEAGHLDQHRDAVAGDDEPVG